MFLIRKNANACCFTFKQAPMLLVEIQYGVIKYSAERRFRSFEQLGTFEKSVRVYHSTKHNTDGFQSSNMIPLIRAEDIWNSKSNAKSLQMVLIESEPFLSIIVGNSGQVEFSPFSCSSSKLQDSSSCARSEKLFEIVLSRHLRGSSLEEKPDEQINRKSSIID